MKLFDTDSAKAWVRSEQFRWVAAVVIAVLALFVAFQAGAAFGFHRAAYGYHLDENYGRTFGTTTARFMQPGTPGGHGAMGKIVSVTPSSIIIANTSGPEQNVMFDADTMIRTQNGNASSSALSAGDLVVIFGEPTEDGSVHARLIRIVPAPSVPTNPTP
jgi:hypothetical protein